MQALGKSLDQYIKQYYGSKPDHFKDDLQKIIYMLHHIDSDTITKEEIRNACGLLKDLSEVVATN